MQISSSEKTIILSLVSDGGNYSHVLNKYAEKDPPWRILVTLSANHQLRNHFDKVIVLPGVWMKPVPKHNNSQKKEHVF